MDIIAQLARELAIPAQQLNATVALMDDGNTVPFIARYRKEATGGLDDIQLRDLEERLTYLRNLDKRRQEIEASMQALGVLTDALTHSLNGAQTLSELDDIYRPYRPKRRTRATIAKERGLEPLANRLLMQDPKDASPESLARAFIDPEKGVPDAETALAGARDILAEMMSDDAGVRGRVRTWVANTAIVATKAAKDEDSVYRLYYDYKEPAHKMPGYRILAVDRGEREGYLKPSVDMDDVRLTGIVSAEFVRTGAPTSSQVQAAAEDAWTRRIKPSAERELRNALTDRAQEAAVRVFAGNLRQLLMQPPIKGKVVLGVDPGFRTGCKLAVVDASGLPLETGVGHFTIPGQTHQKAQSKSLILGMAKRHGVTAIAIGNGTASREAESFIAELLPEMPGCGYMIVNEAGASVYSASKLAADEFPDYDVTERSAVSIARRMQDPLAELVKIDPKAIGVGQYQHDLKESELERALDGVVEGCVNSVGVELSTASAQLLTHVAGIGPQLAKNIVTFRAENGIQSRADLKKVPKLGAKAFEQCAGFLRLEDGKNPLDRTAVHPESYKAAEALLKALGHAKGDVGNLKELPSEVEQRGAAALAQELGIGVPTLRDMVNELVKPGRDPRDELPRPVLRSDVLGMDDLTPGMELQGTVRNVIDFGAFVDIGVHQDGLVHVSRMANRFVRHPSEVVKVGDVVKVWVLEVDQKKGRISLSMLPPNPCQ